MKRLIKLSAIGATLLLSTTLIASNLEVKITKQSEWNNGFCANVEVFNPTNQKELWSVTFDAQGIINNLWNAIYTQDPNSLQTTARGVDWNKYVNPNSTVTFGYCAKKVANTTQTPPPPQEGELTITKKENASWDSGFCENIVVQNNTSHDIDWSITFKSEGIIYNHWNANLTQDPETLEVSANGVDWNNIVKANSTVEFGYCANKITSSNPTTGDDNTNSNDGSTNTDNTDNNSNNSDSNSDDNLVTNPNPTYSGLDLNYTKVLPLALKFYEAQRAAGPFPTVTWRKPAALDDGKDVGRDLSKGWFDAGDHVKFNLPMAYSATMLNWGIIAFKDSYIKVGKLDYAKDQVKYALDYFLNAYNEGEKPNDPGDDIVYYQVGDPGADHAFWGPPELMTMKRPTYSCDAQNRCSEVAAEMAAALASGSIVFQDDPTYASLLLDKAKKLYNFAQTYEGNNGYSAANGYYTSFSGYNDELAWGAIWLYLATGDNSYLEKAKYYVAKAADALRWTQSWDNVSNGVKLLLAKITQEQSYKDAIESNFNFWFNDITYTKGGLAFLDRWGSLRYASTEAFMALLYAKDLQDQNLRDKLISFAKSQIDYILGKNPRESSYVVGFGPNYPINPHHRASHNSKTNDINSPVNNEFLLEGALVGGPKSADDFDYADDRRDYVANEVATDYNAGFTGALAGLISIFDQNVTK